MKILEIKDSKGFFSIDGINWADIDKIDKENLIELANLVLKSSVEMDEYKEDSIANQAHQIIYKSIYGKLVILQSDKDKFKDESDRLYMEAIEQYQK